MQGKKEASGNFATEGQTPSSTHKLQNSNRHREDETLSPGFENGEVVLHEEEGGIKIAKSPSAVGGRPNPLALEGQRCFLTLGLCLG